MDVLSFALRFFIGTYIQVVLLSLGFIRKLKPKKYGLPIWIVSCVALYFIQFFTSVDYPEINGFFNLFGWFDTRFLLVIVLYAVAVFFCFETDVINVVFMITFCTVTQNLCNHVFKVVFFSFVESGIVTAEEFGSSLLSRICNFSMFLIIYPVIYFSVIKKFNSEKKLFKDRYSIILVSAFFCLLAYVYNQFVSKYHNNCTPYSVVSALLCVLLIILMNEIMRRRTIADDNEIMAGIISNSEKMRLTSEKNVELINRKCHDLKHQLAALRLSGETLNDDSIKKIEEAIDIYDSTILTGSRVLDSLFMDKGLSCRENEINLTVFLDGTKFSFMSAVDLYVLFGNAIDNAIESCLKEDKQNRSINVSSSQKGGLFCVEIENTCTKNVQFKGGIPLTSKADDGYHGFGTGSIKHIVEKYGGEVSFAVYDGLFCLDMTFDVTVADLKKERLKSEE